MLCTPAAWAALMIATGMVSALMVHFRRHWSAAPLLAQTFVWSAWAAFTIGAIPGGGVPAAGLIYTFVAWLCLLVAMTYLSEADGGSAS